MSTAILETPAATHAHAHQRTNGTALRRHYRRANVEALLSTTPKVGPQIVAPNNDFSRIAQHMYFLMMRNVASDGFVFSDPARPGTYSVPGCVIAAPSFPANTPGVDQDYVFNWMRDAALTAMEIAAANLPRDAEGAVQPLVDYVKFAQLCQNNATPTLGHACYTIVGQSRPWTEQNDGPALQSLAMLQAYSQLDAPTQVIAKAVIQRNLDYLMGVYQNQTTNLWEEHSGFSFFARSAQLRCFQAIKANRIGIPVPAGIDAAMEWLQSALEEHWNGSIYVSMIPAPIGYDPNIDILCASIYGAIPCTDTKLLATAAKLRSQWADDGSPYQYPINAVDKTLGVGPLLGRYPEDTYDGDMNDHLEGRHPWALCTCNLAQLYYNLARAISTTRTLPMDANSETFFAQLGVTSSTPPGAAATSLIAAADAMLQAVLYHSDHLELSEQFDGASGYEKSVKNLTWSYAAFLSAVRAKTGQSVEG